VLDLKKNMLCVCKKNFSPSVKFFSLTWSSKSLPPSRDCVPYGPFRLVLHVVLAFECSFLLVDNLSENSISYGYYIIIIIIIILLLSSLIRLCAQY
jgi:hypothetical protein